MNNVYKPSLKAGARVRVLATNELGTIADKQPKERTDKSILQCALG